MTDAKKVLAPKCKEQIWTRADIDKLAYDFWAIHPQELDAWYKGDMPTGFKGGVRAWYFASKIRAALTAATERAEKAEAERDALKEALKPFADEAFRYEPDDGDSDLPIWDCQLTLGNLRTARSALESSK